MAITFRPRGGLGNQLFTYAAAYNLACKLEVSLVADLRYLSQDPLRSFELRSFKSSIATLSGIRHRSSRSLGIENLILRGFPVTGPIHFETANSFDASVLDMPNGSTLDGYYQSWRYFSGREADVAREVSQITNPTSHYISMVESLSSLGSWTGLHVRRGDYLTSRGFTVATNEYYERAIAAMRRLVGPQKIVVFSDDLAAARALPALGRGENISFFDPPGELQNVEVLMLLSSASNLIISNSTFSWWAAAVGEHTAGGVDVVIYPRPWLDVADFTDRDLAPPHWFALGR